MSLHDFVYGYADMQMCRYGACTGLRVTKILALEKRTASPNSLILAPIGALAYEALLVGCSGSVCD